LFLFLRIPARSAVNVHKVCIDEGLSFISESSGRIPLFSFRQKCRWSTKSMQGVCRLVKILNLSTKERLKDYYCRECIESRDQITRIYLKDCRKECVQESFGDLSLQVKSWRGIAPLKCSKGDKIEVISQKLKLRRENVDSYCRSHRGVNWAVEILHGELAKLQGS